MGGGESLLTHSGLQYLQYLAQDLKAFKRSMYLCGTRVSWFLVVLRITKSLFSQGQ